MVPVEKVSDKVKIRCKFRCSTVKNDGNGESVELGAQYDTSNPEDVSFSAATPSGKMEFYVTNPAVRGHFQPQKSYYITIEEAD